MPFVNIINERKSGDTEMVDDWAKGLKGEIENQNLKEIRLHECTFGPR
jgi:hypothetical protein